MKYFLVPHLAAYTMAALVCSQSNATEPPKFFALHCEGKLTWSDNIELESSEAVFELRYYDEGRKSFGFLKNIIGIPGDHTLNLDVGATTVIGKGHPFVEGDWAGTHISSFTVSRLSGRFQLAWVARNLREPAPSSAATWSGVCVKADPVRRKF